MLQATKYPSWRHYPWFKNPKDLNSFFFQAWPGSLLFRRKGCISEMALIAQTWPCSSSCFWFLQMLLPQLRWAVLLATMVKEVVGCFVSSLGVINLVALNTTLYCFGHWTLMKSDPITWMLISTTYLMQTQQCTEKNSGRLFLLPLKWNIKGGALKLGSGRRVYSVEFPESSHCPPASLGISCTNLQ